MVKIRNSKHEIRNELRDWELRDWGIKSPNPQIPKSLNS